MDMIRALAVALCMMAPPAAAQSVYKCSDGKSGTVYQSMPCAAGKEQKRRQAPAASVEQPRRQVDDSRERPATGQPSLGAQMITFTGQPSPEACARAKHVRDQALADASMKGEREFHQTLARNVDTACK
jgi:hypothetical protein